MFCLVSELAWWGVWQNTHTSDVWYLYFAGLPTLPAECEPIFSGVPEPSGGKVSLGDAPGLGVTINEKIFR